MGSQMCRASQGTVFPMPTNFRGFNISVKIQSTAAVVDTLYLLDNDLMFIMKHQCVCEALVDISRVKAHTSMAIYRSCGMACYLPGHGVCMEGVIF